MGFFNKIYRADLYVLIDEVQYAAGNVCNRNKIKNTAGQAVWLTVPVTLEKGSASTFRETKIADPNWHRKGLNLVRESYRKAPFFQEYFPQLQSLLSAQYESLAAMNVTLIKHLCEVLGISTPIHLQSEAGVEFGKKNMLNIGIVKHFNGTIYLSGQGARKYNDHDAFREHGLEIEYQEYTAPQYPQINNGFIEKLSVIDLILNVGPDSAKYVCI